MTDDRRRAARKADLARRDAALDAYLASSAATWGPSAPWDFVNAAVAVYDAIRAYDAAHTPAPVGEGSVTSPFTDDKNPQSLTPLVGADPPWLDEAMFEAWSAYCDDHSWSLEHWRECRSSWGESAWKRAATAVLRVAVAHLTDDAVVDEANKGYANYCEPRGMFHGDYGEAMRVALAAAGKVLMGETDG